MFFNPETDLKLPQAIKSHSATQLKSFQLCERKFALEYLYGLRAPPTQSLLLGQAIHKQIEDWYRLGVEPKSALARAGLKNLPLRGQGLIYVERQLTWDGKKDGRPILLTNGVRWNGSIDLIHQPIGVTDWVDVWDHKTTTNLNWAKSNTELAEDWQLNVYARTLFVLSELLTETHLRHNYLVTSTMNQTEVRETTLSREENEYRWSEIERAALDVQDVSALGVVSKDKDYWKRCEPNWSSCGAFGGCSFRDLCNAHKKPDTSTGMFDGFGETKMGLADMLKGSAGAAAPAPAGAIAIAPAKAAGLMAEMQKAAPVVQQSVNVLPPDAPKQGPGIAPPPSTFKTEDDLTAEDQSEAAATAEAPRRGRGRPPKAKDTTVEGEVKAEAKVQTAAQPQNLGFTLCIGCAPITSNMAISLEVVLAKLIENACAQASISNIHALDYSKKAQLVTEALKAFDFGNVGRIYTWTTQDGFTEAILAQVVVPKATAVIRGVR